MTAGAAAGTCGAASAELGQPAPWEWKLQESGSPVMDTWRRTRAQGSLGTAAPVLSGCSCMLIRSLSAAAVSRLSPVIITVRMPMRRSSAKRSLMPPLTMSLSSTTPRTLLPGSDADGTPAAAELDLVRGQGADLGGQRRDEPVLRQRQLSVDRVFDETRLVEAGRLEPGRRPAERAECHLHETLLDLAFAPGTPLWLRCAYDVEHLSDAEIRLATAILQRHTHRGAFDERAVPAEVLEALSTAAQSEGARLCDIVSEDQLIELEVLLSSADAMEQRDARYREELAKWVHDGPLQPDGIPAASVAQSAGSSLRQRDFVLDHPGGVDGSAPAPDRPAVVVLATDDDEPISWLRAGQALAAVLLRAADLGVQAQPLGQVTDILAYRFGLRQTMGIAGLPQLVLRMGFARRAVVTPRRSVDEVLVDVAH